VPSVNPRAFVLQKFETMIAPVSVAAAQVFATVATEKL
jgi:hypothetical protein